MDKPNKSDNIVQTLISYFSAISKTHPEIFEILDESASAQYFNKRQTATKINDLADRIIREISREEEQNEN